MGLSRLFTALQGGTAALAAVQPCVPTILNDGAPSDGRAIALHSYSFCDGILNATAYVRRLDHDKSVTLYFSEDVHGSTAHKPLALIHRGSVPDTSYEWWGSTAALHSSAHLLNVTCHAPAVAQTYASGLQIAIHSGWARQRLGPRAVAPYATPSGLGQDITDWLKVDSASQAGMAKVFLFDNINPSVDNAVNGSVVAARSGPSYPSKQPDYEYHWVRDSSLVFDVVNKLYQASAARGARSAYETLLRQYASRRGREQNEPDQQTGLGEPKFLLNGPVFTGPWGRPQSDGPATAATTIMDFATLYLDNGGDANSVRSELYDSDSNLAAPIKRDLLYVANTWTMPSFDLWEEESSTHFYTRMVQRKALRNGAIFANRMGDNNTSQILSAAAAQLSSQMSQFWDPSRQLLLYEVGPVLLAKQSYKDISVALGIIHGYDNDAQFSYTNEQVLSSLLQIFTSFYDVYGIAKVAQSPDGGILGIPIGRYPEDVYNGVGTSTNGGNPWFLCTATAAEMFYRAVIEYRSIGSIRITATNLAFFQYFAFAVTGLAVGQTITRDQPQFQDIMNAILGWGDAFMRRIKYHSNKGHLTEQYNRDTGFVQGAEDLTWSYAAVLTAALARAEAAGDNGYAEQLANLPTKFFR